MAVLLFLAAAPLVHAGDGDDLDAYKWRVTALWWFSHPSGSFTGKNNSGTFDLSRDFGFGDYSTFTGNVDWRFKRRHHLLFGTSPVTFQPTTTITRTIEFQGETYEVGTKVSANIKSLSFAPGYQYDIIRRNHGYLAIAAQVNLLKSEATLTGTVSVNGQATTQVASGSFFAPLPIVGPHGRWYPLAHCNRLALDGSLQGMYFFGYGNFLSTRASGVIALRRTWRLDLGHQMGTRLRITGSSDQIGIRLTQKGPVAGVGASW